MDNQLLEKLQTFFFASQSPQTGMKEVWRVRFRSDVTGSILEYLTDSYRQAETFREVFKLLHDPSTEPHKVFN